MPITLVRLLAMATATLSMSAAQAAWPERPVRIVVPSAAGGSPADLTAWMQAERLKWGEVVRTSGAKVD